MRGEDAEGEKRQGRRGPARRPASIAQCFHRSSVLLARADDHGSPVKLVGRRRTGSMAAATRTMASSIDHPLPEERPARAPSPAAHPKKRDFVPVPRCGSCGVIAAPSRNRERPSPETRAGASIVTQFARSEARLPESVPTLKPLQEKQQMPRAILPLARPAVGQESEDEGTSTALAPSRRAPALLRALTPAATGSPAASRTNTAQRRQEEWPGGFAVKAGKTVKCLPGSLENWVTRDEIPERSG